MASQEVGWSWEFLSIWPQSSCHLQTSLPAVYSGIRREEVGSLGVPDKLTDVPKAAFNRELFFIVIIILCDLRHVPTSLWAWS